MTNKISKSENHFQIFNGRINDIEYQLKQKKFVSPFLVRNDDFDKLYKDANLIEFRPLYSELESYINYFLFNHKDIVFDILDYNKNPQELRYLVEAFIDLHIEIILHYDSVNKLINDVFLSNLDDIQKNTLITKIKERIINDYLSIFIWPEYHKGKQIVYKGKVFKYGKNEIPIINPIDNNEVISNLNFKDFDKIYKLLDTNGHIEK